MLKRLIDILGSLLGLVILSPIIAYTAWKVSKTMGKPIFFRQIRPGLGGKPFEMIKFRTMRDAKDSDGKPLPDAERITPFGSFMRRTSLDELPELWNVLKGDMSLVGPRPLLMEYLPYFTQEEMTRHNVRPGVTGLAQVSGRNNLGWDERLAIDVEYVKTQNSLLDLKIIFKTIYKVIKKEDVVVIPSSKFGKLSDERKHD